MTLISSPPNPALLYSLAIVTNEGEGEGEAVLVDGGVSSSDSCVVLQEVEDGGGSWEVDAMLDKSGGGGDSLLLCFSFLACCHSRFFRLGTVGGYHCSRHQRTEY